MNAFPMITVIMPVYNVAPYLDAAVHSVLNQTYTNWEMILVDDGSTDGSSGMCDRLASEDGRLRVIHKSNGGLAQARNTGLRAATGTWVVFWDSDDLLSPQTLEVMTANSCGADVVCCGLRFFPEKSPPQWVDREYYFESLEDMGDMAEYFFSRDCINSACTKLYRRESIHITFDETLRHAEDQIFNFEYLQHAKGIRFIPDILYHYRWTNEPTLGKRFWLDQPEISKRAWTMSRSMFANNPQALNYFDKRYIYEIHKQIISLSQLVSIPESERLLILSLYLSEPLLQEACFRKVIKAPAAAELWNLIVEGNPQKAYQFCQNSLDTLLYFSRSFPTD